MAKSMMFGPEWLRRSEVNAGGNGSTMVMPQYEKATYRYGREEMLAFYDECYEAPEPLRVIPGLYVEASQPPLTLLNMSEEEMLIWDMGAFMETNPRQKPTIGLGPNSINPTHGRGRSRGRGTYHYTTYARGFEDHQEGNSNAFGNNRTRVFDRNPSQTDRPWMDRNGASDQGEWSGNENGLSTSPRKEFGTTLRLTSSSSSKEDTNWRKRPGKEEDENWRPSRAAPTTNWRDGGGEKERDHHDNIVTEGQSAAAATAKVPTGPIDRRFLHRLANMHVTNNEGESSGYHKHGNFSYRRGGTTNDKEDLPEWATDSVKGGGTFDSTGAFRTNGSDEEDSSSKGKVKRKADVKGCKGGMSKRDVDKGKRISRVSMPIGSSNMDESSNSNGRGARQKFADKAPPSDISTDTHSSQASNDNHRRCAKDTAFYKEDTTLPSSKVARSMSAFVSKVPDSVKKNTTNDSAAEKLSSMEGLESAAKSSDARVYGIGGVNLASTTSQQQITVPNESPFLASAASATAMNPPLADERGVGGGVTMMLTEESKKNLEMMNKWYYRDPQGETQGPFLTEEMAEWYRQGYFRDDLLMVRRSYENEYYNLEECKMKNGGVPFVEITLQNMEKYRTPSAFSATASTNYDVTMQMPSAAAAVAALRAMQAGNSLSRQPQELSASQHHKGVREMSQSDGWKDQAASIEHQQRVQTSSVANHPSLTTFNIPNPNAMNALLSQIQQQQQSQLQLQPKIYSFPFQQTNAPSQPQQQQQSAAVGTAAVSITPQYYHVQMPQQMQQAADPTLRKGMPDIIGSPQVAEEAAAAGNQDFQQFLKQFGAAASTQAFPLGITEQQAFDMRQWLEKASKVGGITTTAAATMTAAVPPLSSSYPSQSFEPAAAFPMKTERDILKETFPVGMNIECQKDSANRELIDDLRSWFETMSKRKREREEKERLMEFAEEESKRKKLEEAQRSLEEERRKLEIEKRQMDEERKQRVAEEKAKKEEEVKRKREEMKRKKDLELEAKKVADEKRFRELEAKMRQEHLQKHEEQMQQQLKAKQAQQKQQQMKEKVSAGKGGKGQGESNEKQAKGSKKKPTTIGEEVANFKWVEKPVAPPPVKSLAEIQVEEARQLTQQIKQERIEQQLRDRQNADMAAAAKAEAQMNKWNARNLPWKNETWAAANSGEISSASAKGGVAAVVKPTKPSGGGGVGNKGISEQQPQNEGKGGKGTKSGGGNDVVANNNNNNNKGGNSINNNNKKVKGNNSNNNEGAKAQQQQVAGSSSVPATPEELVKWGKKVLSTMRLEIDIPTFINFLQEVESSELVLEYAMEAMGDNSETRSFVAKFVEKRSGEPYVFAAPQTSGGGTRRGRRSGGKKDKGGGAGASASGNNAAANRPNPANEFIEVKGKGKKNKKKMTPLDNTMLGFNVTAAQDRFNKGDLDFPNGRS